MFFLFQSAGSSPFAALQGVLTQRDSQVFCVCVCVFFVLFGVQKTLNKFLKKIYRQKCIDVAPVYFSVFSPQFSLNFFLLSAFRPGFTRLNLPYFMSEEEADFALQAITFVAQHAWKFLPQVKQHFLH
jgi:hypothetical protein